MRPVIRDILLLSTVLVILGCGLISSATPTPPPPQDTSAWVLALRDDFSDPASGFAQDAYAHGRWFYEDGIYGIEVTKQNWVMSTYLGDFNDFALEIDVTAREDNGCAGVLFRVQEAGDQYYRFSICTDGQYSVDKLLSYESEKAEWETLLAWTMSSHVNTGPATNQLQVLCQGARMWFYVNDQLLDSVSDADYASGGIGMQASNFSGEQRALFHFDNLHVRESPE